MALSPLVLVFLFSAISIVLSSLALSNASLARWHAVIAAMKEHAATLDAADELFADHEERILSLEGPDGYWEIKPEYADAANQTFDDVTLLREFQP
jgi:hypothetical protein